MRLQQDEVNDFAVSTDRTTMFCDMCSIVFGCVSLASVHYLVIDKKLFRLGEAAVLLGDQRSGEKVVGWWAEAFIRAALKHLSSTL